MTIDITPLTPAQLDREIDAMVNATAPRVFAVVAESPDLIDARVLAWGLAFDEHVVTTCEETSGFAAHASVTSARRFFERGHAVTKATIKLCWPAARDAPVAIPATPVLPRAARG